MELSNPAKPAQGNTSNNDKKQNANANFEELSSEVKNLTTRLRSLEEKYRNMRTTMQINEKHALDDNKKRNTEMKDFNQEMFDLKKNFKEVKDKMDIIIKELGLTSKKEDVETIQKYLNLWNPVNFVNQNEIIPIVRRALLELGIKSKRDIEEVQEGFLNTEPEKKNVNDEYVY